MSKTIVDDVATGSTLDAALQYAELGYPVFPCRHRGKTPACTHGCLDATTDERQIRDWFASGRNNVGIATGGLSSAAAGTEHSPRGHRTGADRTVTIITSIRKPYGIDGVSVT